MPLTYAIADLHGRYDLLSKAVTNIVEHSKSDRPATIITLGDYVDRGPKKPPSHREADGLGIARPETGLPQGQSRRHHVAVLPSANQGWMVDGQWWRGHPDLLRTELWGHRQREGRAGAASPLDRGAPADARRQASGLRARRRRC